MADLEEIVSAFTELKRLILITAKDSVFAGSLERLEEEAAQLT